MQSLRQCQLLLAGVPSGQAMHATAWQAMGRLEDFIAGRHDPVTDTKKRDDGAKQGRGDGAGRDAQGGRFGNRNQQAPGQEARRQALGALSDAFSCT